MTQKRIGNGDEEMREYRGIRKDNGEWVTGWYVKHPFSDFPETPVDCIIADSFPHEVVPGTVGQFIGLNDKNGKKAYYQDISTNDEGEIYVVCWDEKEAVHYLRGLGPNCIGTKAEDLNISAITKQTIIGNTYENPELLTGESQ